MSEILEKLQETFLDKVTETIRVGRKKCKKDVYSYNPDVQLTMRVSETENIFEYGRADCLPEERHEFVEKALDPCTYSNEQENCW